MAGFQAIETKPAPGAAKGDFVRPGLVRFLATLNGLTEKMHELRLKRCGRAGPIRQRPPQSARWHKGPGVRDRELKGNKQCLDPKEKPLKEDPSGARP